MTEGWNSDTCATQMSYGFRSERRRVNKRWPPQLLGLALCEDSTSVKTMLQLRQQVLTAVDTRL